MSQTEDQLKLLIEVAAKSESAALHAIAKDLDAIGKAAAGVQARILKGPSTGKLFESLNSAFNKNAVNKVLSMIRLMNSDMQKEINKLFSTNEKVAATAATKLRKTLEKSLTTTGKVPGGLGQMMRMAIVNAGLKIPTANVTSGQTLGVKRLENMLLEHLRKGGNLRSLFSPSFAPAGLLMDRTRLSNAIKKAEAAAAGTGPSAKKPIVTPDRSRWSAAQAKLAAAIQGSSSGQTFLAGVFGRGMAAGVLNPATPQAATMLAAKASARWAAAQAKLDAAARGVGPSGKPFIGNLMGQTAIGPMGAWNHFFGGGRQTFGGMKGKGSAAAQFLEQLYGSNILGFAQKQGKTDLSEFIKLMGDKSTGLKAEFKKYEASLGKAGSAHEKEAQVVGKAAGRGGAASYDPNTGTLYNLLGSLSRRRLLPQIPGIVGRGARQIRNMLSLYGYGPGSPGGGQGPRSMMAALGTGPALMRMGASTAGLAAAAGFGAFKLVSAEVGKVLTNGIGILKGVVSNLAVHIIGILGLLQGIRGILHGIEIANREFVGKFVTSALVSHNPRSENTVDKAIDVLVKNSTYTRDEIRASFNELVTLGASMPEALKILQGSVNIGAARGKQDLQNVAKDYLLQLKIGTSEGFRRLTGLRSLVGENPFQRNARIEAAVDRLFGGRGTLLAQVDVLGKIHQNIEEIESALGEALLGTLHRDLLKVSDFLGKIWQAKDVLLDKLGMNYQTVDAVSGSMRPGNVYDWLADNIIGALKNIFVPSGLLGAGTPSFSQDPFGALMAWGEAFFKRFIDIVFMVTPEIFKLASTYEATKLRYILQFFTSYGPKLGLLIGREIWHAFKDESTNIQIRANEKNLAQAKSNLQIDSAIIRDKNSTPAQVKEATENLHKQMAYIQDTTDTLQGLYASINTPEAKAQRAADEADLQNTAANVLKSLNEQIQYDFTDKNGVVRRFMAAVPGDLIANAKAVGDNQLASGLQQLVATAGNAPDLFTRAMGLVASGGATNISGMASSVTPDLSQMVDAYGRPRARGEVGASMGYISNVGALGVGGMGGSRFMGGGLGFGGFQTAAPLTPSNRQWAAGYSSQSGISHENRTMNVVPGYRPNAADAAVNRSVYYSGNPVYN
jgi:hypothetical protein